jgi:hypothetical protein
MTRTGHSFGICRKTPHIKAWGAKLAVSATPTASRYRVSWIAPPSHPFGPWRSRSRLIAQSQHAACCQSVATTKIHFLRRLPYSDATPGNAVATGAAAESSARRPRGSLRRRVKSPVFPGIPPLSVITIYRCDPSLRAADHRRLDDLQKWLDARNPRPPWSLGDTGISTPATADNEVHQFGVVWLTT